MNKNSKILVLGSRGLVGSAIVRNLTAKGYQNISTPIRADLDLLNQSDVYKYFEVNKPEFVFLAAAKVGGIHANNTYRADFIFENLAIQQNVIGAAHKFDVTKFLFLGSSCIYPKNCPQPIKEEYLLTGPLEQTNEPYAIAKIAGLKLCESIRRQYGKEFISVMPTNLYGPNDNFHPENSHVIPGLIARMHKAKLNGDKIFTAWGTGNPRREFLYVDDMADACVFLMEKSEKLPDIINVGTSEDISIKDLVTLIKELIGFDGEIEFDTRKPDGTLRKVLDVSILHSLNWKSKTSLRIGLQKTINTFLNKE